jgi:hypothetical protein
MKKSNSDSDSLVDYTIQALAFQHALDDQVTVATNRSFFKHRPWWDDSPDQAAELGIPKEPLYSQLKNGK